MLARVRASFDRQAMMSTLGVEVISVEPGKVEMSLRHDDRFTQQHGFLHAGAVVRAGRTLVVCRGEAFADGDKRPFAVMQATMTAVYNRPGIAG
jgi:acyl-coenzyme A thioesterase PaaI-like protein